ncbi:MAG: NAD-glutamate dehydrogenase, partial [Deltaproteobacteria bacterium]|nr:NAD-glutamate dehydrogenase [Deltaproteobacteria bacterium]
FPASYESQVDPRAAVNDIRTIHDLEGDADVEINLYRPMGSDPGRLRLRLFQLETRLVLSDVMPMLEHMGLRVMSEHPYEIHCHTGKSVWVYDFGLEFENAENLDLNRVRKQFNKAFKQIWHGKSESDAFNRLILAANLNWREVGVLRSYARYMRQLNFQFSQTYIAQTLSRHIEITQNIVALFRARFEPPAGGASRKDVEEKYEKEILFALEKVPSLDEDLIIRRYLSLIKGTVRTNYFQTDAQGDPQAYLSFKFLPQTIVDMPLPRPQYEIFVYSPRVEGVHLRGGAVARGGLRWSDRPEDYRTEVLGLMKAQQVKNAVIVPVGAKGGFVPKLLPANGTRDEIQQEGIACYQLFIQALLELTDNRVDGQILPPENVLRKDGDDAYFVVAADKGTASFSDIANEISVSKKFWLGDAFASGGSVGYDHKKMGITARGAWVSVRQHFAELGVDIQEEDFSVVGIGDMSGDVFGNGMLLSKHIQLVAAFNHLSILIDPNPDAAASFNERQRLFDMPRSNWADYNSDLISKGGGVFSRSAKSIPISPEMKERFGIQEAALTPDKLIRRLLTTEVDLLWNGGIGTYVKSSEQTHADAGDKTNDALRVNGEDLRCKVVGEGGNLGLTQSGRVEYALTGGSINTDFVDNVGGVDCSDHEVNIKILLNQAVVEGAITEKNRRELLKSMTGSVADLVLGNSYHQGQAISLAEQQALLRMGENRRF